MAEVEPKKRGRKPAGERASTATFIQKMNAVAPADWGTRVKIYCYRVEPIIDRVRSGNLKYIMAYEEAVGEERILADHGSGRYKLVLNHRKPGAEQGDEIDSIYLELLNEAYPPKIPPGDWVEDPRNKKWAWARPAKPAEAAPGGSSSLIDAVRVVNDIRRDTIEEEREKQPAAPAQPDFLAIIQGVAAIMPKPQTATENTILTTVVSLMTSQLEAQRAESKELRDEIRSMRNGPQDKKSAFDMFREGLGLLKDLGPTVKEVLPGLAGLKGAAADAIGGNGRSRMSGWQEFAQPLVSDLLNNPVMSALGQLILIKSQQAAAPQAAGNANPAMPAARPAIAPGQPKTLVDFFNSVWPSMLRYLKEDWAGDEFASWLMDGYGCPYLGIDWRGQAQLTGADNIITAFRTSPFWQQIVTLPNGEQKFIEFVHAFVQWDPNAEDKQDDGIEEGEVIDLTAEEQIANV